MAKIKPDPEISNESLSEETFHPFSNFIVFVLK